MGSPFHPTPTAMGPWDATKDDNGHWGESPTVWVVLCTQGPTPYLPERPEDPNARAPKKQPPHNGAAAAVTNGQSSRGGKTLSGEKLRPPLRNCARPARACALALAAWRPPGSLGRGGPLSQPLTLSLMHLAMEGGIRLELGCTLQSSAVYIAELDCVRPQASSKETANSKETASPPRGHQAHHAGRHAQEALRLLFHCLFLIGPEPCRNSYQWAPSPHLKIASQHRAECKSKAPGGPSDIKVLIPVYFFLDCVLGEHDKNAAAPCISQGREHF